MEGNWRGEKGRAKGRDIAGGGGTAQGQKGKATPKQGLVGERERAGQIQMRSRTKGHQSEGGKRGVVETRGFADAGRSRGVDEEGSNERVG